MLTSLRRLLGWHPSPPPAAAVDSEFRLLAEHNNDIIIRCGNLTLESEWRRAGRSDKQLSLLVLDLYRFKNFKDRYGHQAGDDCLRAVSATIKETIRQAGDLATRVGGGDGGHPA